MDSMGRVMTECGTHGTTAVVRKAHFREVAERVYGIIGSTLTDEPLF
jgi:hypothetical protein